MSASTDNILTDLVEAVKNLSKPKTAAYDTIATVLRVDGPTAWVHIPGGVDETPVSMTINAKPGDTVQIRVGGGSAWVVGNATAPPTDDTTARAAVKKATEAAGSATDFVTDAKNGIFVHPKNNDTDGVRITDAIEILKGGLSFLRAYVESGIAKVRVGREDQGHSIIDSNGMRVFGGADGSEQLANIGYGDGNNTSSGTSKAPFFTLGYRSGTTVGNYSVVEGYGGKATGAHSHAEGTSTEATGQGAHAEGLQTKATATGAHAEGWNTEATNDCAHVEGHGSKATGPYSHAEGKDNTASGGYGSHAEGYGNTASGAYSHAGGVGNTASYDAQTVIGKYATAPASDDLFLVGNGSSNSSRSNAMRLKANGRVEFGGAVGSGLSWATRSEMITAVSALSLDKPYAFYAGATWSSTAGAGSSEAFGTILRSSSTAWHMFFMSGGNLYKSIFTWDGSTSGSFSTTQIG